MPPSRPYEFDCPRLRDALRDPRVGEAVDGFLWNEAEVVRKSLLSSPDATTADEIMHTTRSLAYLQKVLEIWRR